MMMKYCIGIDIGTSGTKTVLFDSLGNAVCSQSAEYPLSQPKNGWAEQDPIDWKNAVLETLTAVVKNSGVAVCDIVGIGLSGQMHGLVMLDENGEVLRPSIIWCDQRTAEECEDIENLVGRERLIEITANPALTGFTASKIMWVKKHEPEIFAKCAHILLPKDYIRYILCGVFATEVSDAAGMQLLDVPKRDWSDEVLEKLGIDRKKLGKVYESPDITGYLTEEIAALTGLTTAVPVVGGAGDNAAAAVGTGVVRDGAAFTTIGTSGVVFLHTDKPVIDPKGRIHTFCCAVPGCWHVMGVTQAAGLSLRWTRDTFCETEIAIAKQQNCDPYEIMTTLAEKSPIGANRLLFLPYLMGERTPHLDPDCRGVFFGLSAMHTKGDIIRAVMEGVSYSLCDCLSVFRELNMDVNTMAVCGGGARSAFWRKMLADLYARPVCRTQNTEGAALGAAILAMVGAGLYSSVPDACDKIIRIADETAPDENNTAAYQPYYKLYKQLYAPLKGAYKELASIE